MLRRSFYPILAGALSAAFAMPVAAQDPIADCDNPITQATGNGLPALAGLIVANVEANVAVPICQVNVDIDALNNSLNNLLRNANIEVLNNSLNNLLQGADIEVEVIDDSPITISVLGGPVLVFS
jgi:hypothetical protein